MERSTTKSKLVSLPIFSGNEKSKQPFLLYPIWLKNWTDHISDYEKSGVNMLMSHIDKEATNKMIAYENSYVKAMAKLDHYYGDERKVIHACIG